MISYPRGDRLLGHAGTVVDKETGVDWAKGKKKQEETINQ